MKKFKITTTKRDYGLRRGKEKMAIWVENEQENKYNIWDLSKKELTPSVMDALKHAFELGYEFCQKDIRRELSSTIDVKIG